MNDRQRQWRIRVAFEPNRFCAEHLIDVYEQLKPVQSQTIAAEPSDKPAATKRAAAKAVQR